MNSHPSNQKALVTAFKDLATAKKAVEALHEDGFPLKQIELVTHDVHAEAPEVKTPKVRETTTSSLIDSSVEWGALGLAAGAIAGLVVPFPGVGIAMILFGGLTGGIIGGMAGIEHAVEDDSVNLPTLEEYEQLVKDGHSLVVLLGSHDDAMRAEEVINDMSYVHSHTYPVHGHEFHEHPTN